MGLNLHYPVPTSRMGVLLTLHGIRNTAIVEFGPMGTANYYDWSASNYGILPNKNHFAVHTTDMDISLGRYEHLLEAVSVIEKEQKPEQIFVLTSSIMNVVGIDAEGIMTEAAASVSTPVMTFPECSGSYMNGMQMAMEKLTSLVPEGGEKQPLTYGILGALPDDFHFQSDVREVKTMMTRYFGARCLCTFPYSCSPEELRQLPGAQVNLVLRQEALRAAQKLAEKTGTPYLYFRPYGRQQTQEALEQLSDLTGWQAHRETLEKDCRETEAFLEAYRGVLRFYHGSRLEKAVLLCGGCDAVRGISRFFSRELELRVYPQVRASFDTELPLYDQDQWDRLIADHPGAVILADGETKLRFGERAGVISAPAVKYLDLTEDRPFTGFRGARNLVQLFDDCKPLG